MAGGAIRARGAGRLPRRLGRRPQGDGAAGGRVAAARAAARAADPDPWRDALRARIGGDDAAAVAEFRRLADEEKALDSQPAASLVLLARQLRVDGQ